MKGFQSRRGKAAKEAHRIKSWTIPPRSPGWMPLDYSIWSEIERRVYDVGAPRAETNDQVQARLRRVALRLPKGYVTRTVLKMKANILATVASAGATTICASGLD